MSMIGREAVLDRMDYYAEGQSWSADVVAGLRQSRRRAWIVAGTSSATALIAVVALALLTPLKTAVPYVIEVERSTGYVQEARIATVGTLSENEAVRQSNLFHYVMARETIDAADIAANYERTVAWSADGARAGYLALWDRSSPDSLVGRYPLGTVVSVTIKGISPLGRNTALVRFATRRSPLGSQRGEVENWQAIIAYRYADRPLSQAQRFINPLGFQVTSYRRDPDAPEPAASSPEVHGMPHAAPLKATPTAEARP